jgi:hypothetical protein
MTERRAATDNYALLTRNQTVTRDITGMIESNLNLKIRVTVMPTPRSGLRPGRPRPATERRDIESNFRC